MPPHGGVHAQGRARPLPKNKQSCDLPCRACPTENETKRRVLHSQGISLTKRSKPRRREVKIYSKTARAGKETKQRGLLSGRFRRTRRSARAACAPPPPRAAPSLRRPGQAETQHLRRQRLHVLHVPNHGPIDPVAAAIAQRFSRHSCTPLFAIPLPSAPITVSANVASVRQRAHVHCLLALVVLNPWIFPG